MKGVLWIYELGLVRCALHMSGRGRLGFELDGAWVGPPCSELVFIGESLDSTECGSLFSRACRQRTPTVEIRRLYQRGLGKMESLGNPS